MTGLQAKERTISGGRRNYLQLKTKGSDHMYIQNELYITTSEEGSGNTTRFLLLVTFEDDSRDETIQDGISIFNLAKNELLKAKEIEHQRETSITTDNRYDLKFRNDLN